MVFSGMTGGGYGYKGLFGAGIGVMGCQWSSRASDIHKKSEYVGIRHFWDIWISRLLCYNRDICWPWNKVKVLVAYLYLTKWYLTCTLQCPSFHSQYHQFEDCGRPIKATWCSKRSQSPHWQYDFLSVYLFAQIGAHKIMVTLGKMLTWYLTQSVNKGDHYLEFEDPKLFTL